MMKLSFISGCFLSFILSIQVSFANDVSDAIAISASQNAIAVTSGVVMRKMGVEPEYIATPTGLVAVPSSEGRDKEGSSDSIDAYQRQNDQAGKQAFFDGAF